MSFVEKKIKLDRDPRKFYTTDVFLYYLKKRRGDRLKIDRIKARCLFCTHCPNQSTTRALGPNAAGHRPRAPVQRGGGDCLLRISLGHKRDVTRRIIGEICNNKIVGFRRRACRTDGRKGKRVLFS